MLLAAVFISQAGQPTPQQNLISTLRGKIIIESSLLRVNTVIKQAIYHCIDIRPKAAYEER